MNTKRLNQLLDRGRTDAELQLSALERAYRIALQTAGRHAAERFLTFSVDHLTADATDPGWSPPQNDQLFDQEAIAADARKQARKAHERALKAVVAPVLSDLGIAYDITNPFVARLLDGLGARAQDMGAAVRNDIANSVLTSYQQGLSVTDAAKAIETAIDEIAPARAAMLARTDLVGLANGASIAAAQAAASDGESAPFKQWLATEDERTRDSHSEADGQIVPLDQAFQVGGEQLMYPGDPDGSDEEVANCRCTVVYLDASEAAGALAASSRSPTEAVASERSMPTSLASPELEPAEIEALAAAVTITVDDGMSVAETAVPIVWRAVLCVEGEPSQDGPSLTRTLQPGGGTWRELPLPLGVMYNDPHSDEVESVVCGRIDAIYRDELDQNVIWGEGIFNPDDIGAKAAEYVGNRSLRGVSINPYVESLTITELDLPAGSEPDAVGKTLLTFEEYVIGGATICPFQALENATIAIVASSADATDIMVITETRFMQGTLAATEPTDTPADTTTTVDELDPRIAASLAKLEQVAKPERMKEYKLGMEIGLYTLNDCLRAEGREPVEGGDERALPLPTSTLATITDRLTAMSQTNEALAAALDRAATHEQQTVSLVASIDALTEKVAAGERVDEAMIETLKSLTGPRAVTFKRDENGRLTGLES